MESMCMLEKRATRHSEPDMSKTYEAMVNEMYSNKLFSETVGRGTEQEIQDAFKEGHRIINKSGWAKADADKHDGETSVYYDEDDLEEGIDTED